MTMTHHSHSHWRQLIPFMVAGLFWSSLVPAATGFAFAPTKLASRQQAFVSTISSNPRVTTTHLYSTMEKTKPKQKTDNNDNDDNDGDEDNENKEDIALNGSSQTKPSLKINKDKSKSDAVITDAKAMDVDPDMNLVRSEVRVWDNFRQKEAIKNPTIPLDVVLERTWDTAEDIFVHLRRKAYEMGTTTLTPEEEATRKTIVVLGSGWAAHALFKVADCLKLRIVVVSPTNHFVFTPMLASASVGTVEYRSMTEAVRAANPMIHEYVEGKATDVDVQNKTVTVKLNNLLTSVGSEDEPPTLTIPYDHLVVSVGSRVDDKNVPGARKHALRLKSTDDAVKLRRAVTECFEYASRPDVSGSDKVEERTRRVTFLIAGGGPTGVELAGELCDLFEDITAKHKGTYPKLANNTRVILAHGGDSLVPQFEEPLRAEALQSLKKKGVEVYLNTRVTEVTDKSATLSRKVIDEKTGQVLPDRVEETIPVGLSVWCAGTAPASFCEQLLEKLPPEARYRDGRINVDRWMRPPMPSPELLGSILVLGDAAAQDAGGTSTGRLLPSTAQVAGQQGAYIARLLSRGHCLNATVPYLAEADENTVFYDPALTNWLKFRGLEKNPPFSFLNLGLLAYVGGNEALTQVQVGDVNVLQKAGSVGFLLWRSVYLVKQVATRNRALVTFDWVKSAIFGRDITRF